VKTSLLDAGRNSIQTGVQEGKSWKWMWCTGSGL